MPDTEKREIAEAILQNIMFPGIMTSDSKSKNSETIKLKPTKSTYRIILSIEGQLAGNDTISQFVRRMMISYFNKPMWEREQIIFHDQVEIIKESCAKKKPISFTIKYKEKELHEVMPYQLVEGKDGMFNYLVCVEMISGIPKVLSYRLNRITNLGLGRKFPPISREILALCKKTADESPQYALNAIEESCVKLNDSGEISYKRIFFGRPNYTRIEDRSDGHYYYFDCSETQLFHYFRRFENSTAVIISPLSLREKLAKFHSQAYENYK